MEPKTPVTRLQEYFAKRGKVPKFELIENENTVGTHNPTFTYRVSGFDKTCVGRGSSKKEAKHAAATSLLTIVESPDFVNSIEDPYSEASKENYVGALQEFCLAYVIHIPTYEAKSSSGLPHAKTFVVECKIHALITVGEGHSKIKAKQIAAYLMLIKLRQLLEEKKLDEVRGKSSEKEKQVEAVERLREQLKTPVTRLQEYFAKRGKVPKFELIENENTVGTHNPTFTYRVSGFDKTCVGRGSSKKEAKHAAATSLLTIVESPDFVNSIEDPYSEASKENYVGALQEFCLAYVIHIPTYEAKSSSGLPHAKTFVVECKIHALITVGEGHSKIKAKQIAAHLMLIKLRELLEEKKLDEVRGKSCAEEKDVKAVERLHEQLKKELTITEKKVPSTFDIDSDYSLLFNSEKCINSKRLRRLINEEYVESIPNPVEYFCQLMIELSSSWKKYYINTRADANVKVLSLQIEGFKDATFFGHGCNYDDAFRAATISALKWFAVMSY